MKTPHRSDLLKRQRVTDTLEAAVARVPLVVLTAPMGYGKTVAARELANRLTQHRVFHITATPGPHNPRYFWDLACRQLEEQRSEIASSLRKTGFPEDAIRRQRLLSQGRKHLADKPTLLIIDDYHWVDSPETDQLLETVVRERLPHLSILLLSRTRPQLPLEELSLKNYVLLFEQELLTFSLEETTQYFELHGITDSDTIQQAQTFSEGWAAALWLSLQSTLAHDTPSPIHDVENLLASTVFEHYSDDDKKLLLQIAAIDSVTPEQAVFISENPSAADQLAQLREKNAFLRYSPLTRRYRLHSIFHDFLNKRRDATEPSDPLFVDTEMLHRQAGEWFAARGALIEAIRYFFQAGTKADFLRILQIFEPPSDGLPVLFDPETLARIFAAIPDEVRCQCPLGYLSFVYHYMSRADMDKGLALLNEAERCFEQAPGLTAEMRGRIRGEIELIRAIEKFNDLFAMCEHYKNAHTLLAATAEGRSAISHAQLIWTFGSPHLSYLYLRDPGAYEKLIRLARDDFSYRYMEVTGGCSGGGHDLFQAEYFLETGQLKKTEMFAQKATYHAKENRQLSTLIAIHFTLARLALAEGRHEDAITLLQNFAPQVDSANHPLLNLSMDLCFAYIAVNLRRLDLVPLWLREGDMTARRNFYQGVSFSRIVHGRVLLITENWAYLDALSQDIPKKLGKYRNLFARIHAGVLHAIAVSHLHGVAEATPILACAVELARPDRIVTTIAEYGKDVLPLLKRLQRQHPHDVFLAFLARRARIYAGNDETTSQKLLTPRERSVLELVAQGGNNAAIADTLGLKPITISKALSRVYQKLGVKNRTEAAHVWRDTL